MEGYGEGWPRARAILASARIRNALKEENIYANLETFHLFISSQAKAKTAAANSEKAKQAEVQKAAYEIIKFYLVVQSHLSLMFVFHKCVLNL